MKVKENKLQNLNSSDKLKIARKRLEFLIFKNTNLSFLNWKNQ